MTVDYAKKRNQGSVFILDNSAKPTFYNPSRHLGMCLPIVLQFVVYLWETTAKHVSTQMLLIYYRQEAAILILLSQVFQILAVVMLP